MAIYICPKCGHGVSTSETHICLFKKPFDNVPEHVKKYRENDCKGWSINKPTQAWF